MTSNNKPTKQNQTNTAARLRASRGSEPVEASMKTCSLLQVSRHSYRLTNLWIRYWISMIVCHMFASDLFLSTNAIWGSNESWNVLDVLRHSWFPPGTLTFVSSSKAPAFPYRFAWLFLRFLISIDFCRPTTKQQKSASTNLGKIARKEMLKGKHLASRLGERVRRASGAPRPAYEAPRNNSVFTPEFSALLMRRPFGSPRQPQDWILESHCRKRLCFIFYILYFLFYILYLWNGF